MSKKYLTNDPIYRNKKYKWNHLMKKIRFIMDCGEKCKHCGKDLLDNPYDADFHHTDPSKKDFLPSHIMHKAYDIAKLEIDKCILLCSACHRKEHFEWKDWHDYKEELIERAKKIHLKKSTQKKKEDFIKYEEKIKTLYLSGLSMHQISIKYGIPMASVTYTIKKLKLKREEDDTIQKLVNKKL